MGANYMEIQLSKRVKRIQPSATLAISARASELKSQGHDIISLSAGEPDFDTPAHVKQAAIQAIQDNFTHYTAVDGMPSLKQAIIEKFKRDNQLDYEAKQILVSCGGKQSFFNLAQALLNDGDEIIIPAPYWVSYPDMALLAGAKPVVINTTSQMRYKFTPTQLEQAITSKTRLLVLNSPSNPSGVAYSRAELRAIAEVLLAHPQILIATDDMYEHILWTEEPFVNILNVAPELYDRTVVLNGVSKVYAMTGWRIGYAGGPASLIAAMKKIQSQSTSNPTSISQVAAAAALNGSQVYIGEMLKAFKQRHEVVFKGLQKIEGIEVIPADGTFYSFPNMQAIIERLPGINNDVELAQFFLDKAGVALVPGSAFGTPGCMRLSFATSLPLLEEALSRLQRVITT